jgi:hypothetical protein
MLRPYPDGIILGDRRNITAPMLRPYPGGKILGDRRNITGPMLHPYPDGIILGDRRNPKAPDRPYRITRNCSSRRVKLSHNNRTIYSSKAYTNGGCSAFKRSRASMDK